MEGKGVSKDILSGKGEKSSGAVTIVEFGISHRLCALWSLRFLCSMEQLYYPKLLSGKKKTLKKKNINNNQKTAKKRTEKRWEVGMHILGKSLGGKKIRRAHSYRERSHTIWCVIGPATLSRPQLQDWQRTGHKTGRRRKRGEECERCRSFAVVPSSNAPLFDGFQHLEPVSFPLSFSFRASECEPQQRIHN